MSNLLIGVLTLSFPIVFTEWLASVVSTIWSHYQTCDASCKKPGAYLRVVLDVDVMQEKWSCMSEHAHLQVLKSFLFVGSPSNARHFFSCKCSAILHKCPTKYKVPWFSFLLFFFNILQESCSLWLLFLLSTEWLYIFHLFGCKFWYRGRNVYIQFSSHQELTTMDQNTQGRGDEVCMHSSSRYWFWCSWQYHRLECV